MSIIADALHAYAIASRRVFKDRAQTIGASEVGQCARRVYWTKMEGDESYGAVRDPAHVNGWGATSRGTVFEDHFWEPALRAKYGDKLRYAGGEQQTLASECLSATPDGLLVDLPRDALAPLGVPDLGKRGELVVEAKTIDPRARLDEPKPEHVYQAQVQMGLLRELTGHRPRFALISYTNASFWDDVVEFPIRFNPKIYSHAKERAATIMLARSAEELKPEGWIAAAKECESCPFTRACGRARTAVPYETNATAEPEFVAELSELARQAKRFEKRVGTGTAKLRAAQNAIRERLRANGLRRVIGEAVSIVWSPVKGRPSFDIPAIRAAAAQAGVNLSEFETVGEASDRLEIRISQQSRRDPNVKRNA